MQSLVFGALEMAVSVEKEAEKSSAPVVKKGGRGLSFEEKRKRLSEYLLQKKDFFQLKDLEKHVPKATGIVTQSVKEVLQSLVDDRLVNAEKIGTSNYFWSFPSTAMQSRQNSRAALQEELQRLRGLRESVEEQLETAMQARKETLERCELLKRHGELEGEFAACSAKLEVHRANDPKLLAQKRIAATTATSAANRWTDNIFTLQSFCANNFSIPRSQFNEQFGLPDDFDYIQI